MSRQTDHRWTAECEIAYQNRLVGTVDGTVTPAHVQALRDAGRLDAAKRYLIITARQMRAFEWSGGRGQKSPMGSTRRVVRHAGKLLAGIWEAEKVLQAGKAQAQAQGENYADFNSPTREHAGDSK